MQRLRERGWLRIVTTVLAFPVLVAISTGVAELRGSDELDGFADLITGECSVCTSDESWGNYPFFFFVIAVVPMTAALALGVAIGLAPPLRRFRSDSLHRA
jgi:hypothetical protein